MEPILVAVLFGILGGIARTGFIFLELYRVRRLSFERFAIVAITLLFAGALGGILFNISWVFSLLGGYAATDLFTALTKIFKSGKIMIK